MSLVTKAVLHRRANQPSALIRVQVQALHPLEGTEHQGQQQLCVPFVVTEGESVRLADALAGKGVVPLA